MPNRLQVLHFLIQKILICSANQLTGFYVRGTLTVKELKSFIREQSIPN